MRLLGSVLVLSATLWFGAYFAAKEKYRLQELAELERAILLLQSQIAYLSAPLTEVLESIGWKAEGVIGEIFAQAAAVMAERKRGSAEEIWTEAWSKRRNQIFLTAEDLDMVLSFGKTLGYLDKAQQEGSICLCCGIWRRHWRRAENDWRKTADFTTASADFRDCSLL